MKGTSEHPSCVCLYVCFSSFLSISFLEPLHCFSTVSQSACVPTGNAFQSPKSTRWRDGKEGNTDRESFISSEATRDTVVCVECLWEGLCLAYVGMGFQIWEGYGHWRFQPFLSCWKLIKCLLPCTVFGAICPFAVLRCSVFGSWFHLLLWHAWQVGGLATPASKARIWVVDSGSWLQALARCHSPTEHTSQNLESSTSSFSASLFCDHWPSTRATQVTGQGLLHLCVLITWQSREPFPLCQ